MSAHTPGPWEVWVFDRTAQTCVRTGPRERAGLIATCTGEERDANALLIAAAPALLTALELFVTAVSTNGAFRPLSHELEVGCAAIAAATEGTVKS